MSCWQPTVCAATTTFATGEPCVQRPLLLECFWWHETANKETPTLTTYCWWWYSVCTAVAAPTPRRASRVGCRTYGRRRSLSWLDREQQGLSRYASEVYDCHAQPASRAAALTSRRRRQSALQRCILLFSACIICKNKPHFSA